MTDVFGFKHSDREFKSADYLDQSAFDEKFEIDLANDYVRNIYHVANKYHVPVLMGAYREMYEYCRKHLIYPGDFDYDKLMDPDTLEQLLKESNPPGLVKAEFREKLVDGSFRWVQYIGISGEDRGVPEGRIYFYVYDIQNQKDRMEGRHSFMYSADARDPVTGLRVREDFLPKAAELVRAEPGTWCCVAMDIQNFRIFRSWFGYEKGNYLLCRIGTYLLGLEKNEKVVSAHFGRDNFALMLRYDEGKIREIFDHVQEIVYSYSRMIGFLPAFGLYVLEEGTAPGLDTYDKAKIAAEEAKLSYTDRVRCFDSCAFQKKKADYELLTEFQEALTNGEISFYVQPQCRISTGKIVGAEALARWNRKDGTVISPGAFVPFLESSGFITELDKCIWEAVCQWLRRLIDKNLSPVPVSVNVSQVDILSMDVAAYLYSLTERHNIPPRLLKVEVTESAYAANFDAITRTVSDLKARGFSVALDDFGQGYSSLNMLDKINADLLKLDMAFLRKENSLSRKGISIVESILSMSKVLEMPVIVEGVENEEQIAFLRNLGCRYAQGYYFYRPMTQAAYEKLLENPEKVDFNGFKSRVTDLFHPRDFLNEHMFTDSMLNQILGPVAYYLLEGDDLTITRFNQPFYRAIGDAKMDTRRTAIQNYVVKSDRSLLYGALRQAEDNAAEGGTCEVRFYKSDNSVFWFRMQFFFLQNEQGKKLFYGQVEDITENREQSIHFFEVLRKQAEVTMCMDLDRNRIQYVTGENTLYQVDLPSMRLDESVRRTAESRIEDEADRRAFVEFFNLDRLKECYRKAVYHEVLSIRFRLDSHPETVDFSTYYIRQSKDQNLTVYAFAKRHERELLENDPLTGMKNRYAYNETLNLLALQVRNREDVAVFSMDINGLKATNDTYGHLAGDELIRTAARGIQQVMSPYGSCFRMGGDEFVAFVYGKTALAESLKHELDHVLSGWIGDLPHEASVSCGYATSEEYPEAELNELVKLADLKMYREKSRYYQQLGLDRRMQQAAFSSLCNSYTKILKVNLTEDKFEIIRVEEAELSRERGYDDTLSTWLLEFARKGQVHPDDRERYLQQVNLDYLRRHFGEGKTQMSFHYRRRIGERFSSVMMEVIAAPDYQPEAQKVFLYVKDVGR